MDVGSVSTILFNKLLTNEYATLKKRQTSNKRYCFIYINIYILFFIQVRISANHGNYIQLVLVL
jgi:hypothetical protein